MSRETDYSPLPIDRRAFLQSVGFSAGAAALVNSTAPTAATETNDTSSMQYELPDLPYEYDALEPHIDQQIMDLHHTGHHQAYVDGANEALAELDEMRDSGEFEDIKPVKRDLAFNLSGHVNHTIFWENMTPDGGGEPSGELAEAIEQSFGSFETFQNEFSQTAEEVESVGWAILFYEPLSDDLVIGQIESQHLLTHQDSTPLLMLDVWEHAYYLQYPNERAGYIEEWWNVVDWDDVTERYETVREQSGQENKTTKSIQEGS